MRISSALFFQTGLNSINAQQSDLVHLFQQIGSGQRMVAPSDDPLAAAEAINISQSHSINLRYADNREIATRSLGVEENTLNSVTALLQDIKTRLVEAGNGTMSDADRMTLADVLRHARSTMLGLANATDGNGQYLFSGSRGSEAAFAQDGTYQGDSRQRNIQVDQTRTLPGSDVGADIFARATPGVTKYLTHAATTPVANAGTGIIGSPALYAPAQANPDYRFEISFTSDTDYQVRVFEGATEITVDPADLPPGVALTGTMDAGKETSIRLPYGVQVKLSGAPAAGDTFHIQPASDANMNVFQTLDTMIAALEQPIDDNAAAKAHFQNVLASTLQRIDINYDNVLTVRASVGARMNEIDALNANGDLRDLSYRSQLSRLEDLDYYTATTQLELRKSALEAAALAFRKIQSTSMFNIARG